MPHLKHHKYHFSPPTITPAIIMYHLSPLTLIPFSIRLYYLLDLHIYESRIGPNTLHLSYLIYTLSFSTIAYKSYYINMQQLKITISTAQLLPIPPKPTIYFLDFIMTILCSSVIIIIVHKILLL